MAQLLPDVVFRLLGSDAQPINGGTASFYQTGTLILASIYSNSGLSVSLPNPISTNSAGLFVNGSNQPTAIYLDEGTTYRVIFKDADGATIRDIDPLALGGGGSDAGFGELAEVEAATVSGATTTIRVDAYSSTTPYDPAGYTRATSEPAHVGKVRSLDRYLPNGTVDAANGGWWTILPDNRGFVSTWQIGRTGIGTDDEDDGEAMQSIFDEPTLGKVWLSPPEDHYVALVGVYLRSNGSLESNNYGVFDTDNYGIRLRGGPNRSPHEPVVGNYELNPASMDERDQNITVKGFTIDGNKANNAGQVEWGHGLQLYAVDGADVGCRTINCQGDGLSIHYAYRPSVGFSHSIGCTNVKGWNTNEDVERQGVAIVWGTDVELHVDSYRARLYGVDMEADVAADEIKRVKLRGTMHQCGDGSTSAGGVAVYGAGAGYAEDIDVDVTVLEPVGDGIVYRVAKGLRIAGSVHTPTRNGIRSTGEDTGPGSIVEVDVDIYTPGQAAGLWDLNGVVTGSIRVHGASTLSSQSIYLRRLKKGTKLHIEMLDGGLAQGMQLYDCDDVVLTGVISGFAAAGVYLTDGTTGTRAEGMDLRGNNTGSFVQDIVETSGCNNNRFNNTQANSFSISGLASSVHIQAVDTYSLQTDAAASVDPRSNAKTIVWNVPITANRQLSLVGGLPNDTFHIVRTAASTGAFNINVGTGPLKALAVGTWCDIRYVGTGWILDRYGAL